MKLRYFSIIIGVLGMCVTVSPIATGETINIGRIFQAFSAADIDTTPTFPGDIQGINLGNVAQFGPLTADETIGGVVLLRQDNAAAAGIIVTPDPAGIAGQAPPNLGATADDNALERVFNFGEFEGTTGFTVSFPVMSGAKYKVQVLMYEFISLYRTFNVDIDGNSGVEDLSVIQNDGYHQDVLSGVSSTSFTVYEAIVSAGSSSLVLDFNPSESFGLPHPLATQDPVNFADATINDTTPFVHGIIVERIPEPTTALIAIIGLSCCGLVRRR